MKSRSNFIDILSIIVAVVLFLAVLALSIYGVKLSLEQFDKTCYADSTNGIVEDNLLIYNDSASLQLSNTSWHTNNVNLVDGVLFNNRTDGNATLCFLVDFPNLTSSYTLSCSVSGVSGTGRIGLAYYSNGNLSNYDYLIFTTNGVFSYTHSYNNYNCIVLRNGTSNSSFKFNWLKLEIGSSFTGYVPKDYTNYGYEQGYQDGRDSYLVDKGYRYLDSFSYFGSVSGTSVTGVDFNSDHYTTTFLFNNKTFMLDRSLNIAMTSSLYPYLVSLYHTYDAILDFYQGIKYQNSLLSGDILITFPFLYQDSDFDICFCFEDTVTGTLDYVTSDDSLHWFWGELLGNYGEYDTYPVYQCQLHYYSSNPVNMYVFNNVLTSDYNGNNLLEAERGLHIPYNCSWANIYATSVGTALSSYDDGYEAGYQEASKTLNYDKVYNSGYNKGYDRGVIDGRSQASDYSFIALFGAVFDAPVQAFSGLLDFNLLGVNLKSFVLALLSLSVIIIVIKIALGGS